MPFQIIRNDITKVKADAIVNTANLNVAIGAGVDTAIYKAAGEEKLLAERAKIGQLEPGKVGITPAFNLKAKYIIHASGPWWEGGDYGEADLLRACYDKSLALAYEHGCKSIAFPLLATGTYGFPKRLGIEIAVNSFTEFLTEHEMEIFLVVFGQKSVRISGELGEEVRSFIDDEYVAATLDEEYRAERPWNREYVEASIDAAEFEDEETEDEETEDEETEDEETEDEEIYDEEAYDEPDNRPKGSIIHGSNMLASLCSPGAKEANEAKEPKLFAVGKAMSLDDALKSMYTDSFEKHLQQLINKKGLKNSEVYAAANISKQYFSKLLKGQVKPSKEKVLALAVGLQLNMDEAVDFLRLAGYALSPVSQTDVIVEYFIRHREYSVMKIDIVLFDYGLSPLSNG